MNALVVSVAALLAALTGAAVGDIVSEEMRGRLDKVPSAVLRVAARRVPAGLRDELHDEWTAELAEILRGAEALPVTRLVRGISFAFGLLRASRGVGRILASLPGSDHASQEAGALAPRTVSSSLVANADQLWRAFASLSERDRSLLRVLAVSPLDAYAEIARVLKMPVESIGPARARALERLKQLLAEQTREGDSTT